VATENSIRPEITSGVANRVIISEHAGNVELLLRWLASLVKSRRRLQAENLVLRNQLNILRRQAARRVRHCDVDRLVFVWLSIACVRP
jgi:hypothetical protein